MLYWKWTEFWFWLVLFEKNHESNFIASWFNFFYSRENFLGVYKFKIKNLYSDPNDGFFLSWAWSWLALLICFFVVAFTIAEFPVFVVCVPTLVYILVHRNWVFAGQESRGALPHTFLILITLTDVSQLCKYLLNLYYTLTFDRLGAFTYKYQLKTQKISATVTKLA